MKGKPKNFICKRCGAAFESTRNLQRHEGRKRPCDPILDVDILPLEQRVSPHRCQYCGRPYSRSDSLARHLKTCKIANTEEGMEKLMDHTLQKQLATQGKEMAEMKAKLAKLDELTTMLKGQLALQTPPSAADANAGRSMVINNGPVAHQTNTTNNIMQVNIRPWDGEDRICVPVALIAEAFNENPRLVEYCRLDDSTRTHAEKASPYVTEALTDLVRRAHADPQARNVYLSSRRADHVLVRMKGGAWEVRSLAEATRLMFDGVATSIHRAILTEAEWMQLPVDVQSAAAWVPIMYEGEPEEYVKRAKAPMAAHLVNTRRALEPKQ